MTSVARRKPFPAVWRANAPSTPCRCPEFPAVPPDPPAEAHPGPVPPLFQLTVVSQTAPYRPKQPASKYGQLSCVTLQVYGGVEPNLTAHATAQNTMPQRTVLFPGQRNSPSRARRDNRQQDVGRAFRVVIHGLASLAQHGVLAERVAGVGVTVKLREVAAGDF